MTPTEPELLQIGLLLTLLVALGAWSRRRRLRRLQAFLGPGSALRRSRFQAPGIEGLRLGFLLSGALALALALGAPSSTAMEESLPEEEPPPSALLRAVDVSASRQSSDLEPTRLATAVELARSLVQSLDGHPVRIGLLLFAGTPYPVLPPTTDHALVIQFLDGLTPTMASAHDPGTLLEAGISGAIALFGEAGAGEERTLLLLTDGETNEGEAALARGGEWLAEAGVALHLVGIGTVEGGEARMPQGPFQAGGLIRGPGGAPHRSRLQEAPLQLLAERAGGEYRRGVNAAEQAEVVRGLLTRLIPERPEPSPIPPPRRDPVPLLALASLLFLLLEGSIDLPLRGPAWRRGAQRPLGELR